MNFKTLHERCLLSAINFKKAEAQIIADLSEAMRHKIYYHYGCGSAHEYVVKQLGLSDELAYIFTRVAGKALQVPELGEAIQKGEISLSKANRLTAVLKPENQEQWLKLASTVSKNQLERKIAEIAPVRERVEWVNPQDEVKEKVTFTQARIQLTLGISEKNMLRLRRVQDLVCQQKGRAVSLEEAMAVALELFISKKDPLEKAKRQHVRGKLLAGAPIFVPGQKNRSAAAKTTKAEVVRSPIPAQVRHQLNLKYQRQCGHQDESGHRCRQKRWLHSHHLQPVAQGGSNQLSNLTLLCSGHHRVVHTQGP